MKPGSWQAIVLYGLAIFCSAFLLFWIQLFFGKTLLPTLGGSPSVWATCLVFFQTLLALGYFYAHWANTRLSFRQQVFVQIGLMLISFAFLPVRLISVGGYPRIDQPLVSTLVVLLVSVGVPFFSIAGISPLLQSWFRRLQLTDAANVYVFYSASNLGSLSSLIVYPFLIEPNVGIGGQGWVWTVMYWAVSSLVGACGWFLLQRKPRVQEIAAAEPAIVNPPTWKQSLTWVAIAFIPSSLLSGVTTFASVQVAPFPLLWAIFLGLYLLTFVLVFAPKPQYLPDDLVMILPFAIAISFGLKFLQIDSLSLTDSFITFFFVVWACHSRLGLTRPDPQHLTHFYLRIAIGGAFGGFFNAIIAPLIFRTYFEYDLVLLLAVFALPALSAHRLRQIKQFGMMTAIILAVSTFSISPFYGKVLYQDRSFFGAYQVIESYNKKMSMLVHGNTAHGFEFLDSRKGEPTGYYTRRSPIGDVFKMVNRIPTARIAIAGLGNGGLSAYTQAGQTWDFYEIDPLMVKLATNWFHYLALSKAPYNIRLGDARIEIEKSTDLYDLIVMDAFTSDAIPQHLITYEAVASYLEHLKPNGLLVYHISNRYLDFEPILGRIAQTLNLASLSRPDPVVSSDEAEDGKFSSHWLVLAPRRERLAPLQNTWSTVRVGERLWSDDSTPVSAALRRHT